MYQPVYKLPHICARCTNDNPTDTHEIQSMPLFSNLAFFFTNRTFKFRVPICASCQRELRIINTAVTIITIISIILGGLIGYYSAFVKNIVVGGFFGLIIGWGVGEIIKFVMNANIGSYTGYRYKFQNKEFMKAFFDQNPHLS
ncbi:MAG: hypothetical protein KAU23_06305 [Anaerolineales bacterium]|nr:hypothetical protein [Anaerolineales bacterium]